MFGKLINVYFSDTIARIFNAFKTGRNGKKRSSVSAFLLIGLIGIGIISILFTFTGLLNEIAGLLFATHPWIFYLIITILNFTLMVIGSVFLAKNLLFDSKDNNILLSLPIKPSTLLLSRIFLLLFYNVIFELFFGIPALIASILNGAQAVEVLLFLGFGLFLPMFSASISALFAWLLSLLMSRIKHKSLFTTIFSLAFFFLYFYVCGNLNVILANLLENIDKVSETLQGINVIYWLGACITTPNFLYFALFCLFFLATITVSYLILSLTFIKTITSNRGFSKIAYKEKSLKTSSANSALLKREFKHLFSSPIYLLNSCVGVLFSFIFAGVMIYSAIDTNSDLNGLIVLLKSTNISHISNIITAVGFLMIMFMASMTLITPPSISIEAKNLWILKSLPTSMENVINNKILVQIIMTMPVALLQAIALIALTKPTVVFGILIFVGIILFYLLSATVGMMEGLRHPNLSWRTETQAVKSSFSVLFTMLILMAGTILAIALFFAFQNVTTDPTFALVSFNLIIALATALSYYYVIKKGPSILNDIQ